MSAVEQLLVKLGHAKHAYSQIRRGHRVTIHPFAVGSVAELITAPEGHRVHYRPGGRAVSQAEYVKAGQSYQAIGTGKRLAPSELAHTIREGALFHGAGPGMNLSDRHPGAHRLATLAAEGASRKAEAASHRAQVWGLGSSTTRIMLHLAAAEQHDKASEAWRNLDMARWQEHRRRYWEHSRSVIIERVTHSPPGSSAWKEAEHLLVTRPKGVPKA